MIDPRPGRRAWGTLLVLVLVACGGGGAPSAEGWTTAVDTLASGALRVVHTPPAAETPTWTLEPNLRIGAMDGTGPDVFGEIRALDVGPGGRIAVLDGQAQEVRLFAPDGSHLRTFGGEGGGPGEFRGAATVAFGPEGVMRVPDVRNQRLSLIHPDSGVIGSHRYEPGLYQLPWPVVVDSTGGLWSRHRPADPAPGEFSSFVFVRLARDGTPGDTLVHPDAAILGDPAGVWELEIPHGRVRIGILNYPSTQVVLDHRARVWSTGHGDPAYRLIRWTADGDTALVLEVDRPPVPTDQAWVDSTVSEIEEQYDTRLDRSRVPDVAPPIESFFFDDDGRLWVQRRSPSASDPVRTLDAFDADSGDYLGTLTTELPLTIWNTPVIRGDMLWGVVPDELDVPAVMRGYMRQGVE